VDPEATLAFTVTTKVKFAVVFAARDAIVQVSVPKVQVQPAGPVSDCAIVFAGVVSVNVMVLAVAGPPLVTVCAYVMFCPAFTGFGLAEFVTLRSACPAPATGILRVAELLFRLVSWVVVVPVSVSVMRVPAGVPAFTVTEKTNVLMVPGARLGLVQPVTKEEQVHPGGAPLKVLKVVLVGMTSLKLTVLQLLGPVLVTTWV
jgi:hypothetical protein